MALPGLAAYLARAEANLRRLEAEDALQSTAACHGLLPSTQPTVTVHEPQEPLRAQPKATSIPLPAPITSSSLVERDAQGTPTSCEPKDVDQSDPTDSSSDDDFQPDESSAGSDSDTGAPSLSSDSAPAPSLSSDSAPVPGLINNWKKAYVALHRLLSEPNTGHGHDVRLCGCILLR